MLAPATVEYLTSLEYREDAERRVCWLPLGGIYWEDEIPDFKELLRLDEADRILVYRLFSIRFRVWEQQELSTEQQDFWESARSQVPNCPIFRRLDLSQEDRQAQLQVQQEAIEGFRDLMSNADAFEINEIADGVQSFSATIRLTNNPESREDEL